MMPIDDSTDLIDGRRKFRSAVLELMREAAEANARHITWVSPEFADWPIDDIELIEILDRWARGRTGRMVWIAHDFGRLRLAAPRLVRWRQTWAHLLDCRAPSGSETADLPSMLLWQDIAVLQMSDCVRWRGRISRLRPELGRARLAVDALLQQAEPAFPATVLGI